MKSVLALLLAAGAFGAGDAVALTLTEAHALALKVSPEVQIRELEDETARENVSIHRARFFPTLKLAAEYTVTNPSSRLTIPKGAFGQGLPAERVDIPTSESGFYNLALHFNQPLYTGGRLTSAVDQARKRQKEATVLVDRERRRLFLAVDRTFREALNAISYVSTVRSIIVAKQERLRVLQELAKEGYSSREEVLQQEADLLGTEAELVAAENRHAMVLRRLGILVGIEDTAQLQVEGAPAPAMAAVSLPEVLAAARQNREDLQAARNRIEAVAAGINEARSTFLPQLYLHGAYVEQQETSITRPRYWQMGVQLEWSLFEGGASLAEMRKRVLELRKARQEHRRATDDILLAAEQAWRGMKEREKVVSAKAKRLEAVHYSHGLMLERYAEGDVKLAEVLLSEAMLLREVNDYQVSLNDLETARSILEEAASTVTAEWFTPISVYKVDIDTLKVLQKLKAGRGNPNVPPASSMP